MNFCLVCGNKLESPQYTSDGKPMYNICPCCGFQSGFDDDDRGMTFEEYRKAWLSEGANWFNQKSKPSGWELKAQLKNINL
ncbi:hypothetical protein [Paenibacillus eucommiae]|uniref:Cysteine-rich CPCC domain-containing protein n=1 Tax=Paenibacillus eucommiae TaxID=1355755 RepID=A0ABS4IM77_9BACL|nr:hypothetical protein [Paenibacillus eucommiae]MBP1988672.1 hypothetical protein [Paenibacillus eucommiae]